MTPKQWQRAMDAFEACRDLAPADRSEAVARMCDGDPDVAREVESLLAFYDKDSGMLDTPALAAGAGLIADAMAPRIIGPYRVLRTIGEGGMGIVYEGADTRSGERVALKVAKPALVREPQLHERFLTETTALRKLRHDNISGFIDSGVTPGGAPWLAMEYIEGEPLIEYQRRTKPAIRQLIALFRTVCRAVSYAHDHAVLHRDIKPSNVLVTRDGAPKLLDFGIARLAETGRDWGDQRTRTQFRMLTPEYASPEQITGDAVTAASDVYSLGILLYELLAGARPADTATPPSRVAPHADL